MNEREGGREEERQRGRADSTIVSFFTREVETRRSRAGEGGAGGGGVVPGE